MKNKINCKEIADMILDNTKETFDFYIKNKGMHVTLLLDDIRTDNDFIKAKKYAFGKLGIDVKQEYYSGRNVELYEGPCGLDDRLNGSQMFIKTSSLYPYKDMEFTRKRYTLSDLLYNISQDNLTIPSRPLAIIDIINHNVDNIKNKKIAILGCDDVMAGCSLSAMLSYSEAIVTNFRGNYILQDRDLSSYDIVVSFLDKPNVIHQRHFGDNRNCICIDGSTCVDDNGCIVGNFDEDIREFQKYTGYEDGVCLMYAAYFVSHFVFYTLINRTNIIDTKTHTRLIEYNTDMFMERECKWLSANNYWVYDMLSFLSGWQDLVSQPEDNADDDDFSWADDDDDFGSEWTDDDDDEIYD